MAETGEIFEVEAILGRRQNPDGQIQYLIRWGGYNSDWDTWEPLSGLQSALEIVAEYEQRQAVDSLCDNKMAKMRMGRKYKLSKDDIPSYDTATAIWNSLDNRLSPPESTSSLSDINEKIDQNSTNLALLNDSKAQMTSLSKRTARIPSQEVTPVRGGTASRRTRLDSTGSTASSLINHEMLPPSKISPVSKVVGRKLSPGRSGSSIDIMPEEARGVPVTRRLSRVDSLTSLTQVDNGDDVPSSKTSPMPKRVAGKVSPRRASHTGEPVTAVGTIKPLATARRSSHLDLPGPAIPAEVSTRNKTSPVAKVIPQIDAPAENCVESNGDNSTQGRGKVKKGSNVVASVKKTKTAVKKVVPKKVVAKRRTLKSGNQGSSLPANVPLSIDCDATSPVRVGSKSPVRSPSAQRMSPRVSMQKSPPQAASGSPQSASPRESASGVSPRQAAKRASPASPTTSPLMIRRLFGADVKRRPPASKTKKPVKKLGSKSDKLNQPKRKPVRVVKRVAKVVKSTGSKKISEDLVEKVENESSESIADNNVTSPISPTEILNKKSVAAKKPVVRKKKVEKSSDEAEPMDISGASQDAMTTTSEDEPVIKKKKPGRKPGQKMKEKIKIKRKLGRPFKDPAVQAAAELRLNQGVAQFVTVTNGPETQETEEVVNGKLKKSVGKKDKPRKVISKKIAGRQQVRPSKSVALIAMQFAQQTKKPITRGKTDVLKNLGMSPKKSSPKKTEAKAGDSESDEKVSEKAASDETVVEKHEHESSGSSVSASAEAEVKSEKSDSASSDKKVQNVSKKPGKAGPKAKLKSGPKSKPEVKTTKTGCAQSGKKLSAKGDAKTARKALVMGVKRPASDDLTDDILCSHSETAQLGGPAKKPKLAFKPRLNLTFKGKLKNKAKNGVEHTAESTPEAEVSFKPLSGSGSPGPSPGKMLLKNSMRPKTKIVKPVPRPPTLMVESPPQPSSPFFINAEPTPYKTPPSSPNSVGSAQQNGESSGHGNHINHCNRASLYISEISTIPVMPVIPSSPSASNYKKYITKVPMLRPLPRRPGTASEEEGVERRLSVRQTESAFRYKDIVVKKCNGYTQVWLATQTKMKNCLNPRVMSELVQVLHNAKYDDSRLVLLSGSNSVFCSGVDLNFLMSGDQRMAAKAMTDAIREFVSVLISFPKPIVASVNGAAIGLGMSLLPLCDIIYASDKASFYCPYARLSQTPEGCASFTFPTVMGLAMANEMLLGGRRLTALEAYQIGLVSQVFWPTSMNQEVIPRLQYMASQSGKALEASKLLIRSHQRTKLEFTNESECHLLYERWCAMDCPRIMRTYLDEMQDILL